MPTAKLSLDASSAMTGLSKRTLQRRIAVGQIRKLAEDARGRTMLEAADILALLDKSLAAEDVALILNADAGDVEAQSEAACVFHELDHQEAAVYFWRLAAEEGNADAMQNLGRCYASGEGVGRDDNLAVMWISKAASMGHPIAQAQMQGLLQRA